MLDSTKDAGRRELERGFTLVELAVTIAIVGILAATAVYWRGSAANNKTAAGTASVAAVSDLTQIKMNYRLALSQLPTTDVDAMNAGLPPTVRGTLRFRSEPAPGQGCSNDVDKVSFRNYIDLMLLQPDGTLLVHKTTALPCGGAEFAHFFKTFDPQGVCFTQFYMIGSGCNAAWVEGLKGTSDKLTGKVFHEPRCYANGTCDPVTVILRQPVPGKAPRNAMVAVSPTGDIVSKQLN